VVLRDELRLNSDKLLVFQRLRGVVPCSDDGTLTPVGELSRLRQLSVRALLSPEGNARRGAEGQNKSPAVTAGRNVTPHSIRALEKNRFTVAALDDWKRQDAGPRILKA